VRYRSRPVVAACALEACDVQWACIGGVYRPLAAITIGEVVMPNRRFLLDALRLQLRRAHRAAKPER
jgi:hypothetical protein